MKKLITIIAAVTISLTSCKKEELLTIVNSTTHYATVEINSDQLSSTTQVMYKNGSVVLDPSITNYSCGDVLTVTAKNTSFQPQNVEILLSVNTNFIKGTEQDLNSGETLTLTHTF